MVEGLLTKVGNTANQYSFSPAPVYAFTYNPLTNPVTSLYTTDIPVHDLLGPCVSGGKAAFAESLYIWAFATDGFNRLAGLDADGGTDAFALEPA
jgi:hypothetical protein